ncbi:MAG: ferritin family protein [Oscillospiraceae bacterium]
MQVTKDLQTYITAELGDAALYIALSKIAPTEMAKKLLLEFSADEKSHADMFNKIYSQITGRKFEPTIPPIVLSGTYCDILKDRILDESGDYRKYDRHFVNTNKNMSALRWTYYLAKTDENVHAIRLMYLLNEDC